MRKKRTKKQWVIFKKTIGTSFPGEWWEECGAERTARNRFKQYYGDEHFRLVCVIYNEA